MFQHLQEAYGCVQKISHFHPVSGVGCACRSLFNCIRSVTRPKNFSDPFAYCAEVGQIDARDALYSGPKMSDALFKDFLVAEKLDVNTDYPDQIKLMTVWRCMDGKV
jgi:hypothetical protein